MFALLIIRKYVP